MLRKSKQREAILKTIRSTDSHPTAEWVYEQVRREVPAISLGTVYRNIKRLRDGGTVSELDFAPVSRFDGHTQDHYHFRCEHCGNIFDVNEPVDESLNRRVAEKTGFRVNRHYLEFRGLCRECQHNA